MVQIAVWFYQNLKNEFNNIQLIVKDLPITWQYITYKESGGFLLRIIYIVRLYLLSKEIIKQKEKQPDEGIISKLVRLNKQEQILDGDELVSSCILLFIAGEETSVSLMGTGLYNLITHPDDFNTLRQNPEKIPTAIEELLRYDAPVQIVGRIAGKDCEVGGKTIKQGETLTICLGSANRDPEVFERADDFVFDRNPNKHLGFGGGAHYCLGDWLARIQTEMMIRSLLERYKTVELLDPVPSWNNNLAIRCLTELPVAIR